jgi:hypothetical protein
VTRRRWTPGRSRDDDSCKGTLRSGARLGVDAVDDLHHRLVGRRLPPEVLAALASPSAAQAFGGSAQVTVQLRGRPGEEAAVWVWPEVKLHRVPVHRPATTLPSGQVQSFTTELVQLPFPVLAHVVGASS